MRTGVSKHAQKDCDDLRAFEMTSSCQFNPQLDDLPKLRRLSNKKIRAICRKLRKFSESSGIPTKEWNKRLARVPIDAIAETLGSLTQLAMHLECESY